jgi:chromosome segregation protein
MRIKQLELNGFKSFMERTVVELPAGVTAIVGPNGCGKSNIVDAIRWVLGEQSPKHLRGAAMEDVVFNGNADNGPLGMAEVSLLMERDEADFAEAAADAEEAGTDGLPPELAKASEILVTRRYFRSGESEYFINRAACRLKDIHELFLGTGVGTKAYAIIEQGRVDQLVNAKPEELRLFLEEAAGTTRFRSRKLAAERKMERTRENLVRVQDVLRELERQMNVLERQARRAAEYHRLKDELRDLDLRVMAARRRAWTAEQAQLGERMASIQAEENALQDEIHRWRGTMSDAQARRAEDEERLRALEREVTDQRLAAADAENRIVHLGARADELAQRAASAEREGDKLAARLDELQREAAVAGAELERLTVEEPAATAALGDAEEHLVRLAAEGAPLERAVEEAKDVLLEGVADEARLRNLVAALRRRHDELEGRRRKLDDEQRLLGERLHENAERAESARSRIARLEEEQAGVVAEQGAVARRQQDLAHDEAAQTVVVQQARAHVTQLQSRADSLRELQARYEGCTRGVASLIGRDAEAAALLASVLRVPAELERAVAAALGARLMQVVVADGTAAVSAIEWLRSSGSGSATVLPREAERRPAVIVPAGPRLVDQIEVDGQHWALAETLLGQVLLADDLGAAVRLWREAVHPVTVVTRAGEAIDPLGAVTGGSEPPLEETVLVRERELRELERGLAAALEVMHGEEARLAELGERSRAAARDMAAAADRLQSIRLDLVAAGKDREQLETDRVRITAELEAGALEAGGLAGEDGALADELRAVQERLAKAEGALAELRARLASRQEALGRWREEHVAAERERTACAVRAASVAERVRAARAEVARCASAIGEVDERLGATRRELAEAGAGVEDTRTQREAAVVARQAAQERAASLSAECDRLRAAIAAAEASLSADDVAEREARERLEGRREERSRAEVALAERRIALEHLAAQLAERYGLELQVLDDVAIEDDGGDADRAERLEALRTRLARMGDVNPAAMGELEELRGRHEFLAAQRTDLESSLEDLRRTITRLARTSRQRFEETFEAANEKLRDVFPKLFPGGAAHLDLATPEEGGEPGVEIVVQPAGKKLQSLTLLSGGEKAMTAVALILSLFLIRPTPFCLLDEVDAPLDEANIGRFNQLIREMAATSQFVLITHNRRTMEVADTLYGITMEQAGVSKIVSVRLSEAA